MQTSKPDSDCGFLGCRLAEHASPAVAPVTAAGLWPGGRIAVRFDTLRGLTDLMDESLAAAPVTTQPVLLLYGCRDTIMPREPVDLFWSQLPRTGRQQRRDYPQGWHLLLRDLEAERVYQDILDFMAQGSALAMATSTRSR